MTLVCDMKAGKVSAIIMSGVNPLYTLANASDFSEGLKNTELSVAFSMKEDETSSEAQIIAAARIKIGIAVEISPVPKPAIICVAAPVTD